MILSADAAVQSGVPLEAEIAIIGAGAVGIALATQLAKGKHRIVVVEAGGPKFDPVQQERFFRAGKVADSRHPPTELYRRRMLGGATSIWGGRCILLDPDDFIPAHGRAGWPIPFEDIKAHVRDALSFLDAGEDEFEFSCPLPQSWNPGCADPEVLLNRVERWSTPVDVWKKWKGTLAKASNIVVLHDATCTEILTSADGNRVRGLQLMTAARNAFELRAPTVVLACGGLETPRLLLASRSVRSRGLGNENDLVGRYFMTHVVGDIGRLRLSSPEVGRELDYSRTREGVYIRRLILLSSPVRHRERLRNIVFRPTIDRIDDPSHRDSILSAMFLAKRFIIPEYARRLVAENNVCGVADVVRHVRNVTLGLPRLSGFGASWIRRRILASRKLPTVFLIRPDSDYPLEFNAEQTPDPESRVTLSNDVDPFGVPRLALYWRVSDSDLEFVCRAYECLRVAIARTGLGEIHLGPDLLNQVRSAAIPQSGHHIGTARMGDSARTGVVSRDGEVWGTKGLYGAGTALFPTSGFANPTLTAVALSFRLAKHLLARPSTSG